MKYLLFIALALIPVLACAQTTTTDPVTIEWDGDSSNHEVAIQKGIEDIIILGETALKEYYIDLQSLNYYGAFVIMVRAYEEIDNVKYYSDWCRSDMDDDVIMVDGVSQTFKYVSVAKPRMFRIK